MDEQAELARFGKRVRQVREQERVTVAELAARTGIDASQISALEAGRFNPTLDEMIDLAEGMGVQLPALAPRD
jgi:transcriptional regulator with XRE-family HTH domain